MPEAEHEHAPESTRVQEIKTGIQIAMPATLAFIPLGLALGVLVVQAGLAWWWGPVFAAFIYAGSLEFLLVGMVATGLPLPQIAITAFLVNFRHVFYALTFPLSRVYAKRLKIYSTFALTDEAYALTLPAKQERWSQERILTIQTLLYVVWISSVAVGAGFGTLIPSWVHGMEFAVSALFIVLALDAYKMRPSNQVGLSAIACAAIGLILTPDSNLLTAMTIFLVGLTVTYLLQRGKLKGATSHD